MSDHVAPDSVSVVIPSRDGTSTIRRTLDSVATGAEFVGEVLVVLSNSSSDYRAMCEAIPREYAPDLKVRVLDSGEPSNGSVARNLGIDEASGRFIAFLDDDDIWSPDRLQVYSREIEARGLECDFCLSSPMENRTVTGERGPNLPSKPYTGGRFDEFLFSVGGGAQTSSLFLPARLARSVRFDDSLTRHQDYDFCLRLVERGVSFEYVDEELGTYFNREGSVSHRGDFDYSSQWLANNESRMSVAAIRGFIVRDLFAAAWADKRVLDLGRFMVQHLSSREALRCLPPMLRRAVGTAAGRLRSRARWSSFDGC